MFSEIISAISKDGRLAGWQKNANEPFILCNIPSFENSVAQSPMAHRFQLLEITGCAVPFQYWELRLQWAIK